MMWRLIVGYCTPPHLLVPKLKLLGFLYYLRARHNITMVGYSIGNYLLVAAIFVTMPLLLIGIPVAVALIKARARHCDRVIRFLEDELAFRRAWNAVNQERKSAPNFSGR